MKTARLIITFIVLVAAIFAFAGCGNTAGGASTVEPSSSVQDQSSAESSSVEESSSSEESSLPATGVPEGLVGTWVTEDDSFVLTVGEDGSMAEGPNYSEYIYFYTATFSGNTIYRTDDRGKHSTITMELDEDLLTLTFEDGSVGKYCRRGVVGEIDALYGEWLNEDGSVSINFYGGSGGFVENGESRMFSYCIRGDKVTIADGSINAYRFEISGDTLTLYSAQSGEVRATYRRAD